MLFPIFSIKEIFSVRARIFEKLKSNWSYRISFVVIILINFGIIHFYSLKHPFLDADNRHYSQKFYKYVITRVPRKYIFVPIYSYIVLHTYEVFKKRL
jgi:hypothetical protein